MKQNVKNAIFVSAIVIAGMALVLGFVLLIFNPNKNLGGGEGPKEAQMPVIVEQPLSKEVELTLNEQGEYVVSSAIINVVAMTEDSGDLRYQWYKNTTDSIDKAVLLDGFMNSSLIVSMFAPTDTPNSQSFKEGTVYFFVRVTNFLAGGGNKSVNSEIAKIDFVKSDKNI
ncbi:MAG: hypothetical protein LBU60_04655 [Clostridiales bacterium]|jgi:hypothetical protein|nr:hypothetical protein [Clostridiales bacterium]